MSGSTHAYLPAKKVHGACAAVIVEIDRARAKANLEVAAEWKRSRFNRVLGWFQTTARVAENMPEYLKEIARLHRAEEEKVVTAVRDLAWAAMQQGSDFTMHVSAEDFGLIAKFYR